MEDLGELPQAAAFERDLGAEWVWGLEDSGHFWALRRWFLERFVMYELGH